MHRLRQWLFSAQFSHTKEVRGGVGIFKRKSICFVNIVETKSNSSCNDGTNKGKHRKKAKGFRWRGEHFCCGMHLWAPVHRATAESRRSWVQIPTISSEYQIFFWKMARYFLNKNLPPLPSKFEPSDYSKEGPLVRLDYVFVNGSMEIFCTPAKRNYLVDF